MELLSMSWADAGFFHWPVDPDALEDVIPGGLLVDTREGRAWVGVVPFRMVGLRLRGSPLSSTFAQVNLRTYVRHRGRRGTYFLSLDAPDPLVVRLSRRVAGLPYYRAEARIRDRTDGTEFGARRTHPGAPPARLVVTYRPLDGAVPASPGEDSFADFLVGRERYYVRRNGRLYAGRVARDRFRLRPGRASVTDNTLLEAAGLDHPGTDPEVLVADGPVDVAAGPVRPIDRA